jgi:taurine transport system permease protein
MSDSAVAHTGPRVAFPTLQHITFRGGGFEIVPKRWGPPAFLIGVLSLWQLSASLDWVNDLFLPSPASVVEAFYQSAVQGDLWMNVQLSLFRLGVGWAIGTFIGIMVGLAMGISSVVRAVSLTGISALFPIPKIALLPLLILWLGIGETSKVSVIALGVFFPMAIATYTAIDAVPRNLIRMAQSFNLPWLDILRKIVLPGAVPGILSGVRISVSIAITLLVAAEMIGARYGIGSFLLAAGNLMQTDQLMVGIVLLSMLGLIFSYLLGFVEKSLLKWR